MISDTQENGEENIASRAVRNFPNNFRGGEKANLMKASRWWKQRDVIISNLANKRQKFSIKSVSSVRQVGSRQRVHKKALSGRGRKRQPWVVWLYATLVEEFDRLRKSGLKFSSKLLKIVAIDILRNSTSEFHANYIEPRTGKPLENCITPRWIQLFQEHHNIVIRSQTGKLMTSPINQLLMEKHVAYHLGQVAREFQAGTLNEDLVENLDETHFIVNMDNGKTLGFRGDDNVKYADVVSGGVGMTMVVRIRGGRHAAIEPAFMIFQNANRNYPINGIPDDIPGVAYRTGPKGWMDKQVLVEYLQERRVIWPDPLGRQRVLFMDNCGGHSETPEQLSALQQLNAVIRKLPKNATHLCQPCDSWIIQKRKEVWSAKWETEKLRMLEQGMWKSGPRSSGKLQNPGKRFFLQLAADSVRAVNEMKDKNGLSYARKAMIRCGLALDLVGSWQESQLFPELRTIISNHRAYFEGKPVCEDGESSADEDENQS